MPVMLRSLIILLIFVSITLADNEKYDLVVAKDGNGDFKSIREAIENLPMYTYERYVIYVKNGIYEERFRIERDYLTIIGESRDSTIIRYNLLRSDWDKAPDYIGTAVVNIHADDVVLKNLTIINTQPEIGPHAFAIYGTGTRTILNNCSVISKGGDTVSLWNYKNGMYYHSNCYFEGAVDFVCPRGWCYIRDSEFYEVKQTASLWHAAVSNPEQKFVIRNSYFDGVNGFKLGRHHYEAQFYLLDCTFSANMADDPIYRVTYPDNPARNRPYLFGERKYFHNCSREGGDYEWFANNLAEAKPGLEPAEITPGWTFGGEWDPENTEPPQIVGWEVKGEILRLYFNELITIVGKPVLETGKGNKLKFSQGHGRNIIEFISRTDLSADELNEPIKFVEGFLKGTTATVAERIIEKTILLNK